MDEFMEHMVATFSIDDATLKEQLSSIFFKQKILFLSIECQKRRIL